MEIGLGGIILTVVISVVIPSWWYIWRIFGKIRIWDFRMVATMIWRQFLICFASSIILSLVMFFGTNSDPGTAVSIIAVQMMEIVMFVMLIIILLLIWGIKWVIREGNLTKTLRVFGLVFLVVIFTWWSMRGKK